MPISVVVADCLMCLLVALYLHFSVKGIRSVFCRKMEWVE